jgi:hypothetical protein
LLDTADRNRELGFAGYQHREIEDTVLLGADQFLAIENEHGLIGGIAKQDGRDLPIKREFRDAQRAVAHDFVEGPVKDRGTLRMEDRVESKAVKNAWWANGETGNKGG